MNFQIVEENNFEKARKKIKSLRNEKSVVFTSGDDELNRKILEKENVDILLLKQASRKDFAKQRNSGLNQVMAKAAKKSGTTIGIFLDEILEAKEKAKSQILARIKQNVELCKKNNLKMRFITQNAKKERNIRDLKSLGLILGMPTSMVKSL